MSLQRLRHVLNSTMTVNVDSSPDTIQRVQEKVASRAADLHAKKKATLPTKTPSLVVALTGVPEIALRPIDLLRKIGELTTPSHVNMASLSASWATRSEERRVGKECRSRWSPY